MSGYLPTIPQPTDLLSNSQGQILNNFNILNTAFGKNHTPFATAENQGKHTFVEMPKLSTQPTLTVPATLAGEGSLFTIGVNYTNPAVTVTELYYTPDASGNAYQLTSCPSATNFAAVTNGWTFLPGGLLLQYGQVSSPGTSGQITFPLAFPSNNPPYSIFLTLERSSASQTVTVDSGTSNPAPTAEKFGYLNSSSGSTILFWMAVGR